MLISVVVMAVIGLAALVTAAVTRNDVVLWVCIAATAIGMVLLTVDTLRARRQRGAQSEADADGVLAFDAHYPDYAASEHASADAIIHDDHMVERAISREERVLHSDTGAGDPDTTVEAVQEQTRRHPWG